MLDGSNTELVVFAVAAFAGSLVAGMAGFAFGLVTSAIWLHLLPPATVATLIAAYAAVIQTQSTWRLRHAVRWRRLVPFILGGIVGVPLGAEVLRFTPPSYMRSALGLFLVAFSIYSLARPRVAPVNSNAGIDTSVGVASGIVGAITGMGGLPVNIWTTMRGWPMDEQRALFQPVAVIMHVLVLLWFGQTGITPAGTWELFLIGLPLVPLGTWLGLKVYGRMNEAIFRRVVLGLLFVSGLTLVPSAFV
jgi:uncharacterized membrane protein YfcA